MNPLQFIVLAIRQIPPLALGILAAIGSYFLILTFSFVAALLQ
jgi:hypothetical protein